MSVNTRRNVAYTLGQSPTQELYPTPIVANRAPTTADQAQVGQMWITTALSVVAPSAVFILQAVVNNLANWIAIDAGTGTFTALVVTGPSTFTGLTNINTTGAAVTNIGVGGTGAVNIGNTTGNTAVTGNLTATGSITAGTTMTAGTGMTVTLGNSTITNGNLVLSTATNKITLPGPVSIMSGAGAPAAGLALEVGDMYINTTAASATTRLYIATAAGTWTNITCAA